MNKLGKLDFVGTMTLGVAAAVLLAAWIANSAQIAARHERQLAQQPVTLTADGRMKMTVVAQAEGAAPTRQINTASARSASGPSISTLAPLFLRP